jgi:hypothetical protein
MSALHQGLVLHPGCVPEKVGINQRLFAHKEKRFKEMEINQPKSIKLKMRGQKLISGVNLQGALKQNRHKTRPWCIWPPFMREHLNHVSFEPNRTVFCHGVFALQTCCCMLRNKM